MEMLNKQIRCSNCKLINDTDIEYCSRCGFPLRDALQADESYAKPLPETFLADISGRKHKLKNPITKIGRQADISFPNDKFMSKIHAELCISENGITITDLSSRNGTMVNGKMISSNISIKNQDRVTLGKTILTLIIDT
jgi:pSer/pThr/pTyr-binding forkhead associated (FHA) protein